MANRTGIYPPINMVRYKVDFRNHCSQGIQIFNQVRVVVVALICRTLIPSMATFLSPMALLSTNPATSLNFLEFFAFHTKGNMFFILRSFLEFRPLL